MVTISVTIDMFLDGRLEIIYLLDGMEYSSTYWDTPNLNKRDYFEPHKKYYAQSKETDLTFKINDIPNGSIILCGKSTLTIGWAGVRTDWVGPGMFETYSLKTLLAGKQFIKVGTESVTKS